MDDQSISRKRSRDNQSERDFFSDLPLSIIHLILELIPIRDAVRTCILSIQWRYIWTSLPHLVFDDEFFHSKADKTSIVECNRLENFIANALSLHQGPIHTFRLSITRMRFCPNVDHWLPCPSRNMPVLFWVHASLYSCRSLTHLGLSQCILPPPPPSFKGFPCLRSLVLHRVVPGPSDPIECLVANSPLLESFEYCFAEDSELRITAPNLKYLQLTGHFKEISVCAPVVAQVSIEMYFRSQQLRHKIYGCNFTKLLGGFTNLERLKGKEGFTKYLSIGIESYDRSLVFHKLTSIKLYHVNSRDRNEISVLVHLIMNAPHLQKLFTSFGYELGALSHIPFSDFGCTPNFTFKKLKVVKMKHVCGEPYELEFIKYLLRSSPVLEKMTLRCSDLLSPDDISKLRTELRTYYRAPNSKIILM